MPEDILQRLGYNPEESARRERPVNGSLENQQEVDNRFNQMMHAEFPEHFEAQTSARMEQQEAHGATSSRELLREDLEKMQASSVEQIGYYIGQMRRDELARHGVYENQEPLG